MPRDKQFFVGQKAFIEKGGKILVLFNQDQKFEFPGGKIKDGEENFEESLKREVKEETGLKIEVVDPFHTWSFSLPKSHVKEGTKVFLVGYKCKYNSGNIHLSKQFSKFKWYDASNYTELKEDSGFYRALEKYFQDQQ